MICGPVGAGKSTVAWRLAEQHRAVRFSLDEWVMQLFGSEAPDPMRFEWWAERCERCSERIWSVCEALLARDVDVILDFGLPHRVQRNQWRARASQVGASTHLHVVNADASLRWERVQVRNRRESETFALVVTEAMFAGSETWWEPPVGEELDSATSFHST
jgi:predicted kinase